MILIISQIIGLGAVALFLLSYQLKKRKQIVWVVCASNALYVLQYVLLGAFTGAIMDALSTVGSFLAGKKHTQPYVKYTKLIAAANLIVIAAAGLIIAIMQRDPIELLPIAGALLQTGGLWCEDEQAIRKFALCGAPFWLVYNYISQAYGAALGSVLAIVSLITAMMRYRKKKDETDNSDYMQGV